MVAENSSSLLGVNQCRMDFQERQVGIPVFFQIRKLKIENEVWSNAFIAIIGCFELYLRSR